MRHGELGQSVKYPEAERARADCREVTPRSRLRKGMLTRRVSESDHREKSNSQAGRGGRFVFLTKSEGRLGLAGQPPENHPFLNRFIEASHLKALTLISHLSTMVGTPICNGVRTGRWHDDSGELYCVWSETRRRGPLRREDSPLSGVPATRLRAPTHFGRGVRRSVCRGS